MCEQCSTENKGKGVLLENEQILFQGTYAESVFSVLDEDVVDPPVFVEEPLDVSLPGVVRQVAQEHASGVAVVIS